MKKTNFLFLFLALTTVCYGQASEIFSAGEYINNPVWAGSSSQFTVNSSGQLQLNSSGFGASYLSTAFVASSLSNYEWQAYVKQSFSPSESNYGRLYLATDQSDLTQPLNGYFLQFGEKLNNDAIELFRQNGSSLPVSVCRGTNGKIANSFAVRVKVTHDSTGLWKLFVDYAGGTNFILDASATDTGITSSSYFGVRCTYTASNATKYYYNDFYAGPLLVDRTPPAVSSVLVTSANSLSVVFSEAIDKLSAETIGNYSANQSLGSPGSASLQPDGKTVLLSFSTNFQNGIQTQLTVSHVKDLAGNEMVPATFPFVFFVAVPPHGKDIIFSEIFADPSPQVGLPAQEYVEIYNRSNSPFNLSGWKFSDGVSTTTFPSQVILPNQYWVVCASTNKNLFVSYGNVLGVSNFPTLNDTGDNLTLRTPGNQTIDSVNYTLEWYHDTDKQQGGWSLEIIDVNNPCSGLDNWTASEDATGGTPGRQNSVYANKPDLTGPLLVSVAAISATQINLTFNETLEKDLSQVSISLSPAVGIQKIGFGNPARTQLSVQLSTALLPRQLYTASVSNLTDCSGNWVQPEFSRWSFALPEPADSLDIVINEVLFNPRTGGVDFVEIYNQSPKYLNLKNWALANYESGAAVKFKVITGSDFILPPAGYLALTSGVATLASHYPNANQKFLFTTSLPSLPDQAGTVAVVSNQGMVVDHFAYTEKMHSSFLKNKEGVSLERISFTEKTNEASNWKSAASSSGFATPGYANSNARPDSKFNDHAVTVEPEIFSPAAPGLDFSKINYKFDQSGLAANIKILDVDGRLIKTLANNETLNYEGFFRWDGDQDDGSRARTGYYVVWFEVYDAGGGLTLFRKRVVVGNRW